MFSRIRLALAVAILLSAITSLAGFAKGGFDYIAVTGANLAEESHFTDPALTEDFFAFANFYEDRTAAPVDPGESYEIIRYYIDGNRNIPFDRLHYYPGTGFVFYDGIENGESEYDGEWYTANPDVKNVFESALTSANAPIPPVEKEQPVQAVSDTQADHPTARSQPVGASVQPFPLVDIVAVVVMTALLIFVSGRQKPSSK